MKFTYIASDNTASDAQSLGASGQDIRVLKVIIGAPADGKVVKLYNKATAFGHASGIGSTDSSDIALYWTQATAGAGKNHTHEIDFGPEGITLDGGAVHTDASNVTVIWELAAE